MRFRHTAPASFLRKRESIKGFTIFEIIVVLVIMGVMVAFAFPNFYTPQEQARALNAQNNLLAIYSAQQNFANNNNGVYCTITTGPIPAGNVACGDSLADINTSLTLNIQDDGTYAYSCAVVGGGPVCTALRSGTANLGLSMILNSPIVLTGLGKNLSCNLAIGCP